MKLDPTNSKALAEKASLLEELGRYDEVALTYGEILEITPENREIMYRQGKALEAMGDFRGCIACYDKILPLTQKY